MQVFGLTGGIASGKSAVTERLAASGIPVFDADQAARIVVEPGQPALQEIRAAFGEAVLADDGTLNRTRLGEIIFADEQARDTLGAITHPYIREHIGRQVMEAANSGSEVAVVDAALMVETGWYQQFAGLIVVWCPSQTQLQRLRARDGSTEDGAQARIDAQMPIEEKKAKADYVVDNSGTLVELDAQVERLVEWLTSAH